MAEQAETRKEKKKKKRKKHALSLPCLPVSLTIEPDSVSDGGGRGIAKPHHYRVLQSPTNPPCDSETRPALTSPI